MTQEHRWPQTVLVLSLALIAAGCSILPTYNLGEGQPRATVYDIGFGSATMCTGGDQWARLPRQPEDNSGQRIYQVPAGQRITLQRDMTWSGDFRVGCTAGLSFLPLDGEAYVFTSFLEGGGCYAELVKVDARERVGVSFEKSIDDPQCE